MGMEIVTSWVVVNIFGGICAYTDFKYLLIKDKITLPAMVLGIAYNTFWGNGWEYAVLGIVLGLAVGILNIIFKGGAGDGKLMMAIGAWLGWFLLIWIIWFASIIALVWYCCRRIVYGTSAKRVIPFGVCLYGGIVALLSIMGITALAGGL